MIRLLAFCLVAPGRCPSQGSALHKHWPPQSAGLGIDTLIERREPTITRSGDRRTERQEMSSKPPAHEAFWRVAEALQAFAAKLDSSITKHSRIAAQS